MKGLEPRMNVSELSLFLGLWNDFQRFVPGLARKAAPLNKKFKKANPKEFGPQTAKGGLHEATLNLLYAPPVLSFHYADIHITIYTDAWNFQVGSVLLQKQQGKTTKPVGDRSRFLTKLAHAYDTTRRKCLAIVWFISILHPYLEGVRFNIRSDPDCLPWIHNVAGATSTLACRRLRLSEIEFHVVRQAKTNFKLSMRCHVRRQMARVQLRSMKTNRSQWSAQPRTPTMKNLSNNYAVQPPTKLFKTTIIFKRQ